MQRAQIDGATEFVRAGLADVVPGYEAIDGRLTRAEAEQLFQAAAAVKSGAIVEIGSHRGRSTIALAAGSRSGPKTPVFAIEPHERCIGGDGSKYGPNDRGKFLRNVLWSKAFGLVRLVNTTSGVAARGWAQPIGLLFIDGDDRYPAVRSYFADWRPKLVDDAAVIFFGATRPGPSRLIGELVAAGCLAVLATTGDLAICRFKNVGMEAKPVQIEAKPAPIEHQAVSAYPALVFELANKETRHQLRKVAQYVYYGGNGSYLYQPIPKCACTSMKTTLLELEGLPVDPNEWRRHKKKLNGFPGAEHLPEASQQALFDGRTNTFKFVFVRDPYTRMASVYADKILQAYKGKSKYWVNLIKTAAGEQGVALSQTITFDEFIRVVSAQTVRKMDPHWRPQYDVGRFGLINWDFVGHLEMLASDLRYVLERLKAPKDLIEKSLQPQNVTGAGYAMWGAVSSETRRAFTTAFEIDFDILHYPLRQLGLAA